MENKRVKKIVILVAALLALTIIGLQFGLTNFMQTFAETNDDVKVEYSAQVNEEKTEAQIQINATPKVPEVEITSIVLPNGQVVNDTTATYKATENGKLTFTINYKLPKASSEQPFINKEPEYEEKQQTTTYQVTGIQPVVEQEAQTPTVSSPESALDGIPDSNPEGSLESAPENNPDSNPESTPEHTPGNAPESNPESTPEHNLTSTPQNTQESNPNSPPALIQPPSLTNGALQQNNLGDTPTVYTPDNAFTFDSSTGTITAYDVSIGGTAVNIPPTIQGTPVKVIGDNGFSYKSLTSVTIPESVTTIGDSAFRNNKLSSVTIPSNVTKIKKYTFLNNNLTSVSIPEGVTSIDWYAFSHNQLTNVTIPSSVTTIGLYAFSENKLTDVTIPKGVTAIEASTFMYNQLTSVTIPEGVTKIDSWAFGHNQLTDVTIPEGVTYINDLAFANNHIAALRIPDSVTQMGNNILQDNIVSGKYYKWDDGSQNYIANLPEQIPDFNPANYNYQSSSPGVTYKKKTGVVSFSSKPTGSDTVSLAVTLKNSHLQQLEGYIKFQNFQPINYTVTLDLQGGQFANDSVPRSFSVLPGQAIGQSLGDNDVAYADGYKLEGWYKDAACTQPFNMMTDKVDANMTLYAKWKWEAAIQNPSIMVSIPANMKLTDYFTENGLMAEAKIAIKLVDAENNQFKPTKNVVIKTDPNPIMERVNHIDTTPTLPLKLIKPNGIDTYENPNEALMTLNYFANSGNPNSATYTVQTKTPMTSLPIGNYSGTIDYTITLE